MTNINYLAKEIHQTAVNSGFWDEDRNMGEMIALMHSELSEALEEHRAGTSNFYIADGKPEGLAVEFADCIIRIFDTMHSLGVDIEEVIKLKMTYNATRPRKHGKAY